MAMRTRSPLPFMALALGVCLAHPVTAQVNEPYIFYVGVFSTPQAGNLALQIEFNAGEDANVVWPETPAGIDLYRRAVGFECSDFERLNSEPLPFSWDYPSYNPLSLDYVDGTTSPGNAYEYMVRAVDSNRDPVIANPDVSVGHATNGETLIGHGTIITYNICGYPGPYF